MYIWSDYNSLDVQLEALGHSIDSKVLKLTPMQDSFLKTLASDAGLTAYTKGLSQSRAGVELMEKLCAFCLKESKIISTYIYPIVNISNELFAKACASEDHNDFVKRLLPYCRYGNVIAEDQSQKICECSWEQLEWTEANPILLALMGIIDFDNMLLYPALRPENNTVLIELAGNKDNFFENKIYKEINLLDKTNRNEYYYYIIGKFIKGVFKPLIIVDTLDADGVDLANNYIQNWLKCLHTDLYFDWELEEWDNDINEISALIADQQFRGLKYSKNPYDYIEAVVNDDPCAIQFRMHQEERQWQPPQFIYRRHIKKCPIWELTYENK